MRHLFAVGFGTNALLISALVVGQVPEPMSDMAPHQDVPMTPSASPPPSGSGAAADPKTSEDPAKRLGDAADKLSEAATSLSAAGQKIAEGADAEDKNEVLAEGRLPWNGFLMKFAEKDKKVITSFGIPEGVLMFHGSLEAPLDSDTRLAPLIGSDHKALPFQLKLAFGYDFMEKTLREMVKARDITQRQCEFYQQEMGKDKPCLASAVRPWISRKLAKGGTDGIGSRSVPKGVDATIGGEFKLGLDQQSIYFSDLASAPKTRTASEMSLSVVARFYPANWLAIPITVGTGYDRRVDAKKVTRCASVPSSETTVTGSACDDNALIATDDATTKLVTHFETALVFAVPIRGNDYTLAPGIDVRERVELIRDGRKINRTSMTVFVTPTSSPIVSRFGVGLEYNVIMNSATGADPAYKKGDRSVYPFVVAGGSL
jgi:hypothetical protein